VGGAGTIADPAKSAKAVAVDVKSADVTTPFDSKYASRLDDVEERKKLLDSDFETGAAPWEHFVFE
jgi:hypothetical protein